MHMTFKQAVIGGVIGVTMAGSNWVLAAEFTGNVAATTNYVWRGVTQIDDGPAVQGGLDYAHDSGFYVGTWASNVDFDGENDPQYELDLYGGYGGEAGNFGRTTIEQDKSYFLLRVPYNSQYNRISFSSISNDVSPYHIQSIALNLP